MKNISIAFGVMFLTACVGTPSPPLPPVLKACPDKRSIACTREYNPVCGFNDMGKKIRTYSNACTACADSHVLGHSSGQCQ